MAEVEVSKEPLECPEEPRYDVPDEKKDSVYENINDLSTFKVGEILNNNTRGKTVCLQGSFHNSTENSLVILEKTAFDVKNLIQESEFFTKDSYLTKVFHNDVYGNFELFPKVELNCKLSAMYCEHNLESLVFFNSY